MPRDTHILRFKVVTVECSSLPNGQQYTIMYHRGSTNRSTPCYSAQNGVINFAAMPEGAAVVHFKSGHSGTRFAPKYIRFMIEEYTRGMPRRLVGETELDATQVLKGFSNVGAGILTVVFRLYGTTAKMKVAVLVYPDHAPPLSFDGLIDPADVAAPEAPQTVKVMNRGEAMMILMGLETLLERQRTMEAAGKRPPQSREEKKLVELEERRKALVGSEGLATEVVKTRCEEVVAVQFTALARKHRNNFVGETAAYLREMALRSGEEFASEDADKHDAATTQEQLNRVNRSIDDVDAQRKKLEEEQVALGRIQHKVDVTQELCANLDKVGQLDAKLKLLEQSRDALAAALLRHAEKKDTELSREVAAIKARIAALQGEQQQMRSKVTHMVGVAAGHVVKWARSKNPPEPEVSTGLRTGSRPTAASPRNVVDDLFSNADKPERSKEAQMLDDVQRRQVMGALKGMRASAPPPTAHSPTSDSSSSGHRTPRDLFAGQEGLPSMGDFSSAADKQKKEAEEAAAAKKKDAEKAAAKKPVNEDPLKPSGLGIDMFSAPPPSASSSSPKGMPSTNDYTRPSFAASQPEVQPMFDLSAMGQSETSRRTGMASQDAGPGFVLEPQRPEPTRTGPPAPPAVTVSPAYNRKDDPYYDEMDDFTVPPDNDNNAYAAVEFTGGFPGFGDDTTSSPLRANAAASSSPATAAGYTVTRPTFDFGPSGGFNDDVGTMGGGGGASMNPPAPAAFFGGGSSEEPSTTNRSAEDRNNPYSGISNLPNYNFGS
ncbi:putative mitochondrial hypothetical protein [Leptomonas pyrrhocoris]|uniref:C2 NT-type domain-containing protein n=1 Tax=Leptomonas pyrrhocoris TaxID=157538 RepID=A0A0M9FTQ8_LEPPY|nr:putative mitochondrial hypothetical protein [Leptomonas pyrrhocoris]XP_015654324.1 putative mitochondrial hypothetical protein [Leptomonas pyrrhocoris]KPA75884.1 putative mitochondrial hypothetical protein [Leptomonas pyrrhocoris]KPA75885.1 putative mitochondrial hypothetical protein [Leptomonas pyrrhocoris]|eukprot:XP_015654323.1 putative mitochondrial hypothetical protein [Leptomonas pyrrhocoris]